VVGVVSQPDRGRGRGRKKTPSPVSQVALDAGLPLVRPERVGEPEVVEALRAWRPDLGVVAAFGQFLPKSVRELPAEGYLINAHASLLPRHRGAAPIARAILEGDPRTGISVMRVEREMDAGAVALVRATPIGPDEDCGSLTARLAGLARDAVAEAIEQIADGSVRWTQQDHGAATLAPKLTREDARLDWHDAAAALARRVRAMAPRPGAVTQLDGEPLRILAARAIEGEARGRPGEVQRASGEWPVRVSTGSGWLAPLRLQRAGARPLDVAEFLRGRPIDEGTILGAGTGPESTPAS
jgi:methionyl-tRNA formyltransferase